MQDLLFYVSDFEDELAEDWRLSQRLLRDTVTPAGARFLRELTNNDDEYANYTNFRNDDDWAVDDDYLFPFWGTMLFVIAGAVLLVLLIWFFVWFCCVKGKEQRKLSRVNGSTMRGRSDT